VQFAEQLDLFGEIINGQTRRGTIPDVRAQHLHPSETSVMLDRHPYFGTKRAVGGCLRKQYLRYYLEPSSDEGYPTEDIGPAEIGNLLQDFVEKNLFEKADLLLQSELQIYLPQWNVSGRIDTILKKDTIVVPISDPANSNQTLAIPAMQLLPGSVVTGSPYLYRQMFGVEVKSKDGYYSEKEYIRCQKSANPKDFRPQDEHIMQAMIYLYAFQTLPLLKKYNINKWLMFYVLRENGKYNYFELTMTDANSTHGAGWPRISSYANPTPFVYKRFNMSGVIKRWEELNFCIKHQIIPDRDYSLMYNPAELTSLAMNEYPYLGKENKEKIQQGRFSEVILKKGTQFERPMGDFECYVCPYKSKCWGLQNRQAEVFDCTTNPCSYAKPIKYSQFDPLKSDYFDKLTDEDKSLVRKDIGIVT